MTNDAEPAKTINVEDPIQFAWQQIAAQAAEWLRAGRVPAGIKPVLVFHQPINGLDLTTRERYVEIRGDIVDGRTAPLGKARIIKRLYSSLKVSESRIQTP